METTNEQDPDASDQPAVGPVSAPHDTASAVLTNSLERLAINPSAATTPSSPATAPVSPTQTRKPPIQRSNTQESQPRASSRRRSSGGLAAIPPSPRLNRRSSGLSQQPDSPSRASPRRTSSQNFSSRPATAHAPSTSSIPESEIPSWTAGSVAADYFKRELELHKPSQYSKPDTLVIVHDSCYGHRFSRRKTTKSSLSLIVERPERLRAGVIGLSSAYVRLGERHAAGQHQPHPHRSPPLNLPFLISKSTRSTPLTSSAVTNVHGTKWMHDLAIMCNSAHTKLAAGAKELTRPDTPNTAAKPKLHEGDLYLCQESLDAFQGALGGVLDAVDAVFGYDYSLPEPAPQHKKAFVCVRPPGHHCSADMPSGFCWLNNVHVGIEHAALSHGLTHAAIIDFDLHHGDGSQTITWERNAKAARMPKNAPVSKKTSIGYFSLHDINSYPCEWGDPDKVQSASLCIENAHNQSIWNVHLQPWKTEEDFWKLYESRYLVLLEKASAFLNAQTSRIRSSSSTVKPKAAVFISAGFDASEWEGEGMQRHKVNVPTEFYARFTADILKLAEEHGTSVEGRVISVLEGGYSDRALISGIMSHLSGLAGPIKSQTNDSGYNHSSSDASPGKFNTEWWSSAALAELEAALAPEPVLPASRKIRSSELSTFATPTQSFTAKVVDPSKVYRSLSGVASPPPQPPRAPTPPPPDVDWAVAAHELSKLLIPTDRRVNSYKHEELAEPRVKQERHSSIGLPTVPPPQQQHQTRGRKAKIPADAAAAPANKANVKTRSSSNSRRRTLSDLPSVPDEASAEVVNSAHAPAERPTTADSKAYSEGSAAPWAIVSDALPSTGNDSLGQLRPGKTRRQSGILADIQRLNDAATLESDVQQSAEPEAGETASNGVLANKTAAPQAAQSDPSKTAEMDSLTSGVKKITLRMNPKAPPEPKPAPAKKAPSKAPRKSTAPRAPKTASAASKPTTSRSAKISKAGANFPAPVAENTTNIAMSVAASDQPHSASLDEEHVPLNATLAAHTADYSQNLPITNGTSVEKPESTSEQQELVADPLSFENGDVKQAEPTSNPTAEQTTLHMSSSSGMEFVPYQPAQAAANFTGVKPEALTWLPPNTNTPTGTPVAKRGKENLPVFTSHGPIPFAAAPHPLETDTKPTTTATEPPISYDPENAHSGQQGAPKVEDDSIWEVSDSPPRRA